MAMFTRRVLQKCIDGSVTYTSKAVRHNWVKRLNSSSEPAYAAVEWEVVLLYAIARFGGLRHEPQLTPNGPLIDVVFGSDDIGFAADITTVSDRGLHQKNPVDELEKRLEEIYNAQKLSQGAITFGAFDISAGRRPKQASIVPPVAEFDRLIFNDAFLLWIDSLKNHPESPSTHQVTYRNPLSVIRFMYVPGRTGVASVGHTDYTVTHSLTDNALYRVLASKASKLKKSGWTGKTGIIVCDGGAGVFRQSFGGNIAAPQIVLEFLRRHASVGFVAVFSLRNISTQTVKQAVESRIYVSKIEAWHETLSRLITAITASLPQVMQGADNASSELRFWEGKKHVHFGGLTVKYGTTQVKEVRFSARMLLDVLSGRIPVQQLNQRFSGRGEKSVFESLAASGVMIKAARIERRESEDDDDLILTFGEPDPAVSPFRIPSEKAE